MTTKACRKAHKKAGTKETPVKSQVEAGAMGAALAAKRGKKPVSELQGPSMQMYRGMTSEELEVHLRGKKIGKLPKRVKKKK